MDNIASVVISNATRKFDREYHYLIPEHLVEKVVPGQRVLVPFGESNRTVEAYVLDTLSSTDINNLKKIVSVVDEVTVLNKKLLQLALWMKERYICTCSDVIKCMLPPGIGVKSLKIIKLLKHADDVKPVRKKILELLAEAGNECEYEELKTRSGSREFSRHIKALADAGYIDISEEYTTRVRQKTIRAAYLVLPPEVIIDEIESNRIKRIQQIRILEMLLDNEYIAVADVVRFSGCSASVLDTLKKYGYIDYRDIEINRDPLKDKTVEQTKPFVPTEQQAEAINRVKERLDEKRYGEVLIHGITGSGKTEVYLQLIQYCFDNGKKAIVLVPEISLTPQMVDRFKGRFGENVAVLHSRLSMGERYDQWRMIRDGKIKVVVGARSAVFAPVENLGMIIIDEEHESSYKSEITPKYHARDVARERCKIENAVLMLGSATPSVETYHRAMEGQIDFLQLTDRANNALLPRVEIVDMRRELEEGNRSVFSKRLAEEMGKNIESGQQTILFLNRRGYASFVLCRNCGYTVKCANCNITMTYHAHDERLICHYCGYTTRNPSICPKCKSNYIRHFGTGTQKVEEEIKKQFPSGTVIRMDMDTTTYKNSHEEILTAFREKNVNIMVGTQMIAKGHDFPNVTLVGVLAADSLLNFNDYKASEKTFQLVTQVAGRAGRGELPGRVVIQSYNTEDFSIVTACRHDYASFYNQEIKVREMLCYPPFTNIATVTFSGIFDRQVYSKAQEIRNIIAELFDKYAVAADILGPARSPLTRIKNKFRWRIVIKCKDMDKLIDILTEVSDGFYKKKEKNPVELSVDVNPVNML